jgi:hypothetical protein
VAQDLADALTPDSTLLGREHIAMYQRVLAEARLLVRRQDIGLMLIHWPVPHLPRIYDRKTGQLSLSGTYLDNLELVDRTLGEIRREMENAGTWESSTILVTADHRWRPNHWNQLPAWLGEEGAVFARQQDYRVVFLLKMAGQKEGRTIEESFNTVLIHDLILEILAGRIATPDQAVAWIHAQPTAGRGESFFLANQ